MATPHRPTWGRRLLGVLALIAIGGGLVSLRFVLPVRDEGDRLRARCSGGEASACVSWGARLERDGALDGAARAYRRACELKLPAGCAETGRTTLLGLGGSADPRGARAWLAQACLPGEVAGCGLLGALLYDGEGGEPDRVEGSSLLRRGCDGGETQWCTFLADRLRRNGPSPEALADSTRLYAIACGRKDRDGCRELGNALLCGRGALPHREQAVEPLLRACEADDAEACATLASLWNTGLHPVDVQSSATFPRIAQLAATEALEHGRLETAEALISGLEGWKQRVPETIFLRAALDLEAGRLDEAADRARLLGSLSNDPAVRVLQRVAEGRRTGKAAAPELLVSAWVAAGRPELRGTRFLPSQGRVTPWACTAAPNPVPTDRPLLDRLGAALQMDRARPRDVSDAVTALRAPDPATRRIALAVLWVNHDDPRGEPIAKGALEDAVARYRAEHPGDLFGALYAAALEPALTPERFTQLVAATRFEHPWEPIYTAFLAGRSTRGAQARAFAATVNVFVTPNLFGLRERLVANAKPAERAALAATFALVGRELLRSDWLVHALFGGTWLEAGAKLTGDQAAAEEAKRELDRARRLFDSPVPELGRWPLTFSPAVWWSPETLGHERSAAERLARSAQ